MDSDYHEWTVYADNELAFVKARTQKEAITKALELGIRPERSSDARPRTGDAELMSRAEFNEFVDY